MEAELYSELWVDFYRITWRCILEAIGLHCHRCKYLGSSVMIVDICSLGETKEDIDYS
jgi:hypothetical protein